MEKKANIYDIARITGTTITSVSRAFDPEGKLSADKRERILAAAEKYGYKPNRAAGSLSRKKIKLGFILIDNISEYNVELISGFNSALDRLADFGVTGEVCMVKPGEDETSQVVSLLDRFAAQGCGGILLSVFFTPGINDKVAELSKLGIPTATVSSDAPDGVRLFSVQNDLDTAGRMAAQLLSVLIPGGGALVFSGHASSFIHSRLISGFEREAEQRGLRVLGAYDTKDDPKLAAELSVKAFSEHPEARGVYISSANSLPIINYIKAHFPPRTVRVVASDVFPQLCEEISAGVVDATIYQNPYRQAKLAAERMYAYLCEHSLEEEICRVTPQIVLQTNLKLYTEGKVHI